MTAYSSWAFATLALLGLATPSQGEPPLRAMTFNIRYGTANDGAHAWPNRREAVAETIRRFDPDLLGVQEALAFQLDFLSKELPGYQVAGVGRDDGKRAGEHAAIFLRCDRFEVDDSGTRWLSDAPDQPGSITWGGAHPRVYTWVTLSEKSNGRRLHVVNTHWDHQSQESREKSAAVIAAHLEQPSVAGLPVIVMGDLNAGPENAALEALLSPETGLRDAWRLANPDSAPPTTFSGFRDRPRGRQIDWLLVSSDWRVDAAHVLTAKIDGQIPSDHYPVAATLHLGE